METWIALFRGINVGGKNTLPMAELRGDLEALKLKSVRTYIQSGNVVFNSNAKSAKSLADKIAKQVSERHGFRPKLVMLKSEELVDAIDSNPFRKAVSDPKALHFFFLAEPTSAPDIKALDNAKTGTEEYQLTRRVFYLHTPDGVARSKLAANVEKHLGVAATARNYRTVEKLKIMATDARA